MPKEPAEGVPSDEQVLDRAMELFPKLGVSEAWFGHAVGSNRLSTIRDSRTQTSFDKTAEKRVTRTIARGVFLPRATNGIAFAGRGTYDGLYVNIGSRGEIAELEFVCRNLQVHRVQPTALPQELIARIRSGKAVAQPDNVPTTSARLLIRKATPYYFAADALELQQFIVPFVSLQTHVEAATTNAEVVINCPVLK